MGDMDKFAGEEMDVIYQATDEDFNFFESQVRKLVFLELLEVQGARLEEGKLPVFHQWQ